MVLIKFNFLSDMSSFFVLGISFIFVLLIQWCGNIFYLNSRKRKKKSLC